MTARAIQLTLQGYQVAEGTFPVQGFYLLHPDPAQLPQVGRFFAQGSAVWDRIPEELAALGEPKTGAAKWDRLRDNLIHSTSLAHTQIALLLWPPTRPHSLPPLLRSETSATRSTPPA